MATSKDTYKELKNSYYKLPATKNIEEFNSLMAEFISTGKGKEKREKVAKRLLKSNNTSHLYYCKLSRKNESDSDSKTPLSRMNVAELQSELEARKITFPPKSTKKIMRDLIIDHDSKNSNK